MAQTNSTELNKTGNNDYMADDKSDTSYDKSHQHQDLHCYRKIPISEYVDFENVFEDPWTELEFNSKAGKCRQDICEPNINVPDEKILKKSDTSNCLIGISSSYKDVNENSCVNLNLESIDLNQCSENGHFISNNLKLKNDAAYIDNSPKEKKSRIGLQGQTDSLQNVQLKNDFEISQGQLRNQCNLDRYSDISDFLSGITESSDLNHLSDDSVFERINDTIITLSHSNEKTKYNHNFVGSKISSITFFSKMKDLVMKILFNFKMFLWQR